MEETKRPWGEYIVTEKKKILKIKPNSALSLQYHKFRTEFWTVIEGEGSAYIDGVKHELKVGTHLTIPPLVKHNIVTEESSLVILETAVGNVDEDDIVRLEDKYGRA